MKDIHLVRIPDRGITEQLVTFMDDFVLERAGRGKALLDIGCGRGVFTNQLSEKFSMVTGIDIIQEEIFAGTGRNGRGVYSVMDAHQLAFKDETFDTIISRYTLHHLDLKKVSSLKISPPYKISTRNKHIKSRISVCYSNRTLFEGEHLGKRCLVFEDLKGPHHIKAVPY